MENKTSIMISSVCMPLGAGVMFFSLLSEFSILFLITGGLIMLLPLALFKNKLKGSASYDKKTYNWYREKYPDSVQGDIVTCSRCETNTLDIRPLKNEIFKREIYCTECGKTLYYFNI